MTRRLFIQNIKQHLLTGIQGIKKGIRQEESENPGQSEVRGLLSGCCIRYDTQIFRTLCSRNT